jgi:hypothetical protein
MPTTRIITHRLPSKPSLMFKERKRYKEIIKVVIALTYRVGSEQSRTRGSQLFGSCVPPNQK